MDISKNIGCREKNVEVQGRNTQYLNNSKGIDDNRWFAAEVIDDKFFDCEVESKSWGKWSCGAAIDGVERLWKLCNGSIWTLWREERVGWGWDGKGERARVVCVCPEEVALTFM